MKVSLFTVATIGLLVACKDKQATSLEEKQSLRRSAVDQVASVPASAPPVMDVARMSSGVVGNVAAAESPAPPPAPSNRAAVAGTASEINPTMLIRTGNASIEVDKLDPAIVKVRQLAQQLGGYIANSSMSGGRDQIRSATLELKIPAARYDQAIGGLGGIGKVEAVNTSVEDVGEEYVDIEARVTNSKRLEQRLVELLATRTGKLQDVLAVERELARVREEIERYEGRMRYLRTRASVSTLSINIHEPVPILGRNPGSNPIVAAFRQAWRNLVGLVAWLIASLGVVIPLGMIALAGWYGYRRYRARNK